jgi:hypothetical protein
MIDEPARPTEVTVMKNAWTMVALLGVIPGLFVACGRGRTPVPAEAQVVHIAVIESELRLDRATVRAGDVHIVLDTPRSSVGFASRKLGAVETGPLSEDDVARLAHGDTQGLGIGGFDLSGCSNAQRAEDLGLMGPCGNVFRVTLVEGTYAFLGPGWTEQTTETTRPLVAPTVGPPGLLPRSVAVLQVLP